MKNKKVVENRKHRLTERKWFNLYDDIISSVAEERAACLLYHGFNRAFDTGSFGILVGKLGRYSLDERMEN